MVTWWSGTVESYDLHSPKGRGEEVIYLMGFTSPSGAADRKEPGIFCVPTLQHTTEVVHNKEP